MRHKETKENTTDKYILRQRESRETEGVRQRELEGDTTRKRQHRGSQRETEGGKGRQREKNMSRERRRP